MRAVTQIAIALLAGSMASAANAQTESWIIAGDGDKPNRELFVVDERSISEKTDLAGFMQSATPEEYATYLKQSRRKGKLKPGEARVGPEVRVEIWVDEVFESPTKPNRITSEYQVDCIRATLAVTEGLVQWRDRKPEHFGARPPRGPASFGEAQLLKFVCFRGQDGRGRDAAASDPELGYMFIGDTGLSPADFIWQNLWNDGKRPAMTYRPSEAELAADEQRLAASLASAKARADGIIDSHQRNVGRVGRSTLMETWIGKAESDFIGAWGTPDRFVDGHGGVRTLYYRKGYVNRGTNVYGHTLSEDHHWCDVSVETHGGVIKDYATDGNSCPELLR